MTSSALFSDLWGNSAICDEISISVSPERPNGSRTFCLNGGTMAEHVNLFPSYLLDENHSRISASSDGAVFLSGHLLLAAAQGDPAAVSTDRSSRQLFHEHLVTVSSMSMATSG